MEKITVSFDAKAGQYKATLYGSANVAYGEQKHLARENLIREIRHMGRINMQPRFHRRESITEMALTSRFIRRRVNV